MLMNEGGRLFLALCLACLIVLCMVDAKKDKSKDSSEKDKSDSKEDNSKDNSKEKNSKDSSKEKNSKDSSKEDKNSKGSSKCPDGENVEKKDVCYYYNSTALSWEQAGTQCGLQQGLLVTSKSVGEGKQILKDVRNKLQSGSSTYQLWTGMYRDKGGTYYTSNGEDVNSGVKNQIEKDPNVQGAACVAADTTNDKKITLKVKDCSSALPFLCMVDTANDVWGRWGTWADCSATCGQGTRKRQRSCFKASAGKSSSTCKGNAANTENCSSLLACQDYQWGKWGQWSSCSVTCGKGERSRTRSCVDSVSNTQNDTQCTGDRQETQTCKMTACVVYGWEVWGSWTACSQTCGGGRRSRTRRCVDQASNQGASGDVSSKCPGPKSQNDQCNQLKCPDYQWGQWGQWSTCSVTCGKGERSRTRSCVDSVSNTQNDTQCTGDRQETQTCKMTACVVYGWEVWGSWTACSQTCGGGRRSRTRRCVDQASNQGASGDVSSKCPGPKSQNDQCNQLKCPDYQWGQWGQWSTCSVTCGKGERSRTRSCVDSVSNTQNDTQCTGDRQETQTCKMTACVVYGWEVWGSWTTCSQTCGGGLRSRSRRCVDQASNQEASGDVSSKCPGPKLWNEQCNQLKCPGYQWGQWGQWSTCSVTCGEGERSRTRSCVDSVSNTQNDTQCTGDRQETQTCKMTACVVYGWEVWGLWTACSQTCGGGRRSRTRRCVNQASNQEVSGDVSSKCPGPKSQNDQCNQLKCPDYQWGQWGQWSKCSVTCGEGERSRTRSCVDSVSNTQNDTQCTGDRQETQTCKMTACVVYGWEVWGSWTACSQTCGGGGRSRTRRCVDQASNQEASVDVSSKCPGPMSQNDQCNQLKCPDYKWGQWGQWSTCSVTCGEGERSRTRSCVDSVSTTQNDTQCTGDRQETQTCKMKACVAEPSWETWGQWTACSKSCGMGVRSRVRTCTAAGVASKNGCQGKPSQTRKCFMGCKNLSKAEMVKQIKSEMKDSKTVARLEKWAQGTAHMTENLFTCELLTKYAIYGHIIATHSVYTSMDCAMKCLKAGCKSFNLQLNPDEKGRHVCELNSVNREEALGDVRKRVGYVLYDYRTYVPFVDDLD